MKSFLRLLLSVVVSGFVALILSSCGGGGAATPDATVTATGSLKSEALAVGVVSGAGSQLTVSSIHLQSSVRISRTVFQYEYQVDLLNNGVALNSATVTLQAVGLGTTIVSGRIITGPIAAGATYAKGTVTVQQDRTIPFSAASWTWLTTPVPVLTSSLFSQVSLYPEISNPLLLSFLLPGGPVATLYGQKDSNGILEIPGGIMFKASDGTLQNVQQDSTGRPSSVSLQGVGRLNFTCTDNSNAVVTVSTTDGQTSTVPLTLPSPLPQFTSSSLARTKSLTKRLAGTAGVISTTNAELDVAVSSSVPESGATVWAAVSTNSGASVTHYPLYEYSPGVYKTSFVNYSSAILPSVETEACETIVDTYTSTCKVLANDEPGAFNFSEFMANGACVLFVNKKLVSACVAAFTASAGACAATHTLPEGTTPALCQAIQDDINLFDPDGVDIKVTATKGSRSGSATTRVPSNVAETQLTLTLPPSPTVPVGPVITDGLSQLSNVAFPIQITTESDLKVNFVADPTACSEYRIHLLVDGAEKVVSPLLSPGGSTGFMNVGPVSAGNHVVGFRAEGTVGGCNKGILYSWSGSAAFDTN